MDEKIKGNPMDDDEKIKQKCFKMTENVLTSTYFIHG